MPDVLSTIYFYQTVVCLSQEMECEKWRVAMAEIGEPDRVIRRERDPVIPPLAPVPTPELVPAEG